MGDVLDLDAVAAEEAGDPFAFRFGGEAYELPANPDARALATLAAVNAQHPERVYEALVLLLGPEQWERMKGSPVVFDNARMKALVEAYAAHLGTSLPESQASRRS